MAMVLFSASGDAPRDGEFSFLFPKTKKFIETGTVPDKWPGGVADGSRPGFLYRRIQAHGLSRRGQLVSQFRSPNWELTPFLDGAKLQQPAVFIAGEHDVVGKMIPGGYEIAGAFTPNLKKKVIVPGAGHWIQQERPKETNEALIEFLKSL